MPRTAVTRPCAWEHCSDTVTFTPGRGAPRKWCDAHKRAAYNGRPVKVTCPICAATFTSDANRVKRYASVYCSTTCRDHAIRKVWPTSNLPDDHWARWYGSTSAWAPPKAGARFFANVCSDCESPFVEIAYGVPSDYCSTTCARRASRRRRRAREHDAPGEFTHSQLIRQYIKQGKVCAYCRHTARGLPDPEHVLPLSRGGRNDMSNLVAACRPCNADKGDLTLDEWALSREARGLPPVTTALDGDAYRHLRIQAPTTAAYRDRTSVRLAA